MEEKSAAPSLGLANILGLERGGGGEVGVAVKAERLGGGGCLVPETWHGIGVQPVKMLTVALTAVWCAYQGRPLLALSVAGTRKHPPHPHTHVNAMGLTSHQTDTRPLKPSGATSALAP